MANKTTNDAAVAYNALMIRATEIVDIEAGSDLAGTAITKALQESRIYPDKSILEIAQQILGIELAIHYFSSRNENEALRDLAATVREPHQIQEPINYQDILAKNVHRMNDLEKLVAYGILNGRSPQQIAERYGVSVGYIDHLNLIIYSELNTGEETI
jgi:hypothetical protein